MNAAVDDVAEALQQQRAVDYVTRALNAVARGIERELGRPVVLRDLLGGLRDASTLAAAIDLDTLKRVEDVLAGLVSACGPEAQFIDCEADNSAVPLAVLVERLQTVQEAAAPFLALRSKERRATR